MGLNKFFDAARLWHPDNCGSPATPRTPLVTQRWAEGKLRHIQLSQSTNSKVGRLAYEFQHSVLSVQMDEGLRIQAT